MENESNPLLAEIDRQLSIEYIKLQLAEIDEELKKIRKIKAEYGCDIDDPMRLLASKEERLTSERDELLKKLEIREQAQAEAENQHREHVDGAQV